MESSYQAPASTGNLYYYYYPVAAYPLDEKNDSDELDPLVLVLLPVSILIGFLALLSIFSKSHVSLLVSSNPTLSCLDVSVTGRGRSFQSKSDSVYGTVDQLKVRNIHKSLLDKSSEEFIAASFSSSAELVLLKQKEETHSTIFYKREPRAEERSSIKMLIGRFKEIKKISDQSQSENFNSYFQAKVDTLLENYYLALESESCMDRYQSYNDKLSQSYH